MPVSSERKIFCGVGAFVTDVITPTKCRFFAVLEVTQPIDFTRVTRKLEVDLACSPLGYQDGKCTWAEVVVDDRGVTDRGVTESEPGVGEPMPLSVTPWGLEQYGATTIGPTFGAVGAMLGGIYLEENFFERKFNEHIALDPADPPDPRYTWPPPTYRRYELMTVAYSRDPVNGERAGLRYAGVHAKVQMLSASGRRAAVTIFKPGTSDPVGTHILDLDNKKHVDDSVPVPSGFDALQAMEGSEGALFIELTRLAKLAVRGPKEPPGKPQ